MVTHCELGNFRAANDVYISTAIGNAAWPIGLTMVGIHERSGREKISTSKVQNFYFKRQINLTIIVFFK
jgi:pre-mRNA-splicing factor 18